jgi:hypothetical protein
MRFAIAFASGVLGLVVLSAGVAQQAKQPPARYDIEADLDNYPQSEPKAALESVLKAIDKKKIDYLLAQLSDPQWVDNSVQKVYGGKFHDLVKETAAKLATDPTEVEELRRFLREGTWDTGDAEAHATLKDVQDRRVSFRKIEGRWYLENQKKPDKGK